MGLVSEEKEGERLLNSEGEEGVVCLGILSGLQLSLRDAKNSLRLSLPALSFLELEGEEEEERRSLRWGECY